uniref:F-box domain-containing protein n=1 Tax=Mycena chlorophos TaxID=658473 RepID=A0ABQ0LYF7_MYCCL|nr:predicted protein [Mycena chlorophos]
MSEPRLPPELEHAIFKVAAMNFPGTIPTLMRVSRRVLEWTEPLLYRVLQFQMETIPTEGFLRAIRANSQEFAARSVESIFFEAPQDISRELGTELLRKCTGIVRFGTTYPFTGTAVLEALGNLPNLRHLTLNLGSLLSWDDGSVPDASLDPLPAAFRNITHLSLIDYMIDDADEHNTYALLPRLPKLTHLAMRRGAMSDNAIRTLLPSRPQLRVLLLTDNTNPFPLPDGLPSADPRLVFGFLSTEYRGFWGDWLSGSKGDRDMWALSYETVQGRINSKASHESWSSSDAWISMSTEPISRNQPVSPELDRKLDYSRMDDELLPSLPAGQE